MVDIVDIVWHYLATILSESSALDHMDWWSALSIDDDANTNVIVDDDTMAMIQDYDDIDEHHHHRFDHNDAAAVDDGDEEEDGEDDVAAVVDDDDEDDGVLYHRYQSNFRHLQYRFHSIHRHNYCSLVDNDD